MISYVMLYVSNGGVANVLYQEANSSKLVIVYESFLAIVFHVVIEEVILLNYLYDVGIFKT